MKWKIKHINWIIAIVWLANGLICKLLNVVPRHETIIAEILGDEYSSVFRVLIGTSEVLMFIWIVSGIKGNLAAITQILIILGMNVLEFILVPDLLLWGRFNILFALALCALIYWNNFKRKSTYAY